MKGQKLIDRLSDIYGKENLKITDFPDGEYYVEVVNTKYVDENGNELKPKETENDFFASVLASMGIIRYEDGVLRQV